MNNKKGKKKMSFTRFTNLLYEASSSLVPGTGELYNTQYAYKEEGKKENEEGKEKNNGQFH